MGLLKEFIRIWVIAHIPHANSFENWMCERNRACEFLREGMRNAGYAFEMNFLFFFRFSWI